MEYIRQGDILKIEKRKQDYPENQRFYWFSGIFLFWQTYCLVLRNGLMGFIRGFVQTKA